MILFQMLDTVYLSGFFSNNTLINYASSNCKMQRGLMNNARDKHEHRNKWSQISHHISLASTVTYHCCCCFRNRLGRGHLGKVLKNSSVTFISEEPQRTHLNSVYQTRLICPRNVHKQFMLRKERSLQKLQEHAKNLCLIHNFIHFYCVKNDRTSLASISRPLAIFGHAL